MLSKKNIILIISFFAGLIIIINILSENIKSGDDSYISATSEKISFNEVKEYLNKSDFSNQKADSYFKNGVANKFTLKFLKYLQGQYKDMNYDAHLDAIKKYLYSVMDSNEAERFFELYKKYIDYENRIAKEINNSGMMKTTDDYLNMLKKMKNLQVELFGQENAEIIFGAMMKSQEYPIRRAGILSNTSMYASEKEKLLKKLNSDMWGEDASMVENTRKPYVAYNETLSLYSRDLSEMNDIQRQNKISEIRNSIFPGDVVQRLESVDKQLLSEKNRDEAYNQDYNRIMNNSNLSTEEKKREIRNLQDNTYGSEAESIRRMENMEKEKKDMLDKYKIN